MLTLATLRSSKRLRKISRSNALAALGRAARTPSCSSTRLSTQAPATNSPRMARIADLLLPVSITLIVKIAGPKTVANRSATAKKPKNSDVRSARNQPREQRAAQRLRAALHGRDQERQQEEVHRRWS